jgi:hypothetical protein
MMEQMEHRYRIEFPDHGTEISFTANSKSANNLLTALLTHHSNDYVIIWRETYVFDGAADSKDSHAALKSLL